jgi:hypothetical protein
VSQIRLFKTWFAVSTSTQSGFPPSGFSKPSFSNLPLRNRVCQIRLWDLHFFESEFGKIEFVQIECGKSNLCSPLIETRFANMGNAKPGFPMLFFYTGFANLTLLFWVSDCCLLLCILSILQFLNFPFPPPIPPHTQNKNSTKTKNRITTQNDVRHNRQKRKRGKAKKQ